MSICEIVTGRGYGFAGAGVVAGAVRAHGENRPEGFEPDWDLIRLLAQMLVRTFEHSEAAAPATLASACRGAVGKVMTREGREPPGPRSESRFGLPRQHGTVIDPAADVVPKPENYVAFYARRGAETADPRAQDRTLAARRGAVAAFRRSGSARQC